MRDSKKFWNKNANKYANSVIKNELTYQKKLAITQQYLNKNSVVLEFGCGSGSTAMIHAPYVKQILATDISDKMIEIAQKKANDYDIKNITFQQNTIDKLVHQQQEFDVILGLNILHLLEDIDSSLCHVNKLLKGNGLFISSTSLIGEVNIVFRWLIALMQFAGLAPYVCVLTKKQLISKLINTGFSIELEWQSNNESVFIVAKNRT